MEDREGAKIAGECARLGSHRRAPKLTGKCPEGLIEELAEQASSDGKGSCHFVAYDLAKQARLANPFFSLAKQNEISQFEKLL